MTIEIEPVAALGRQRIFSRTTGLPHALDGPAEACKGQAMNEHYERDRASPLAFAPLKTPINQRPQ